MVSLPRLPLPGALALIAAACASPRGEKMPFREVFPAPVALSPAQANPAEGQKAGAPRPEAVGSVELQSALVSFGVRARKHRAEAPEGSPMPSEQVRNWLQLQSAVDDFLDTPAKKTSSYDVIRARVTIEAELELDGRRYGDIPAYLADEVTDRISHLAVRMAELRRLKVRPREIAPDFVWPVDPVMVTSLYGRRFHPILKVNKQHSGIDLAADLGQSVNAAARGTVLRAEWTATGGNLLEISHGPNVTTRYEHLSYFLVQPGEVVNQGDPVGLAGQSGTATGPHLHFEFWRDGRPCDPLEELDFGPARAGPVARNAPPPARPRPPVAPVSATAEP